MTKPRALSSSLMKYSFPINRKVLHFKRLNRMLLENSFQLVQLKNWKNSRERIFTWHLSFDFHLDKFPFAPGTCLRILFFWDRKRSVDSHVCIVHSPLPKLPAQLYWQERMASCLLTYFQWLIIQEMLILF